MKRNDSKVVDIDVTDIKAVLENEQMKMYEVEPSKRLNKTGKIYNESSISNSGSDESIK